MDCKNRKVSSELSTDSDKAKTIEIEDWDADLVLIVEYKSHSGCKTSLLPAMLNQEEID